MTPADAQASLAAARAAFAAGRHDEALRQADLQLIVLHYGFDQRCDVVVGLDQHALTVTLHNVDHGWNLQRNAFES